MDGGDSAGAAASGAGPGEPASRASFFNDYWSSLENHGWAAVVLHGWKGLPERIDSDVDYAVAGPSPGELLRFLASYCRSRGWLLVQVIEHEPGAYYCVCMQEVLPFDWLALDVTWDYRRIGHVLVPSDLLTGDCRRADGKSFRVPSPGAECCYLLAKGAAKGKRFDEIRVRVGELLAEDAGGCRAVVHAAFQTEFPDGGGDSTHLAAVAAWFDRTPAFQSVRAGRRFGMEELALYVRRIVRPAGFRLVLAGGGRRCPRVEEAVETLVPLFRRVQRRGRVWPWQIPDVLQRVIRTTLVVEERTGEARSAGCRKTALGVMADPEQEDMIPTVLRHLAARIDARVESL
jgi:hypothetical protein